MKNNRSLGRGLDVLIPAYTEKYDTDEEEQSTSEVPLSQIRPNENQPRKLFDDERIQELSDSIRTHGILQPLIVVPSGPDHFVIVAGERRWRAAELAGLKTVPVIIKDYSESEALAISLVENLQRQDLNDIEKASTYERLLNHFNLTHDSLAEVLGISRTAVTNTLRLLSLTDAEKTALLQGQISSGHARALLSLPEGVSRTACLKAIIKNSLSVRETEKLVKNILTPKERIEKARDVHLVQMEGELCEVFGSKVSIQDTAGKGKVSIEFYNKDDRDRILEFLLQLKD